MDRATLEILVGTPSGLAMLPPLLVAGVAFRRALMSRSRNFTSYAAVALVAGVVLQVNLLFIASVPVWVLVVSGLAVLFLWLEVRHRADARRRVHIQKPGTRLRTSY